MIALADGMLTSPAELSLPMLTRFLKRASGAIGLAGSVEVLLTSDGELRRLNRQFRGKNKATDILSFPAAQARLGLPAADTHAGDLAVSLDTAARQAAEHGHTLAVEVCVLLLHGLLHLAGMDHETDGGEMREREAELRRELRLPTSLIARTVGPAMEDSPGEAVGRGRHRRSAAAVRADKPAAGTRGLRR